MPNITWSDDLSLGVPQVDADHRAILGLIDMLSEAMTAGDAASVLGTAINVIVDYSDYHFMREETLLADRGFAGLEEHCAKHRAFSAMARDIAACYETAPASVVPATVRDFLEYWWRDHILKEDAAYGRQFAQAAR